MKGQLKKSDWRQQQKRVALDRNVVCKLGHDMYALLLRSMMFHHRLRVGASDKGVFERIVLRGFCVKSNLHQARGIRSREVCIQARTRR